MKKIILLVIFILITFVSQTTYLTACSHTEGEVAPNSKSVPFSYSIPETQDISSEALGELADIVKSYVEEERIVGVELMVLKSRYNVMYKEYSCKDQEAEIPMQKNTLFNIRSITKPITGTAVQMLIYRGDLQLDDQVADYLPGFDNELSENITLEQLLMHQARLPLTILSSADDYKDLITMANEVGERGPEFPPGSKLCGIAMLIL